MQCSNAKTNSWGKMKTTGAKTNKPLDLRILNQVAFTAAQTQTKIWDPQLAIWCIRRWVRIKSSFYFCSDCISLSSSSLSLSCFKLCAWENMAGWERERVHACIGMWGARFIHMHMGSSWNFTPKQWKRISVTSKTPLMHMWLTLIMILVDLIPFLSILLKKEEKRQRELPLGVA